MLDNKIFTSPHLASLLLLLKITANSNSEKKCTRILARNLVLKLTKDRNANELRLVTVCLKQIQGFACILQWSRLSLNVITDCGSLIKFLNDLHG